ncbi:hypothetical protein [Heyndrickxia sporothermodurans]
MFFYKDGNFNQAIKTLDNAIRLTSSKGKVYGEREVEILISKGNLYTDNNNYEMALKTYKSALSHLKNIPRLENIYIPVRLYYNLSRCLRFSKDYSNSLINCDLALKIGKKNKLLYLKGDLFIQMGLNYKALNNFRDAIENFKLAEIAFTLQDSEENIKFAQSKIKETSLLLS